MVFFVTVVYSGFRWRKSPTKRETHRTQMNFRRTSLSAVSMMFAVFTAHAGTGSLTVSLNTTPSALKCSGTGQYVNRLAIRVVPGGSGKVYIGQSGMNTATGAGVAQILFPNGGAHSEEFSIADLTMEDGINMCSLYIAGDVAGETALIDYGYQTGVAGANPLVLINAQRYATSSAFLNTATFDAVPCNTGCLFNKIRVQVIPGQTGKIQLTWANWHKSTYGNFHVLFPNSGNRAQHSGWSEDWTLQDPLGENGLEQYSRVGNGQASQGSGWGIHSDVTGEGVQVQMWQKQTTTGTTIAPAHGRRDFAGDSLTYGSTPQSISVRSWATPTQVRVVPGYCNKMFIGTASMNTATLAGVEKVLFPNCSGGWSERLSLPSGNAAANMNFATGLTVEDLSGIGVNPLNAGNPVTLQNYPVAVGIGSVQHVLISVVPGGSGKVFVGNATMNTTTLAGVYAVLFPNSVGRFSEQFELVDPQGDGIDTSSLYVLGGVPGEQVTVATATTGVTPASPLVAKIGAGLANTATNAADLIAASSTGVAFLRLQTLPGETGKVVVGTDAMASHLQPDYSLAGAVKVLWPNTGNYNVAEGHSETFVVKCSDGSNCADASKYSFYTYNPGEHIIVSAWGR